MSTDSSPLDRQQAAVDALMEAFGSNTYRIVIAVADRLQLSVAYVDRLTFEAHIERSLDDDEWEQINAAFSAMDFDQYVGDADAFRTEWVDTVLTVVAEDGTPISQRASRAAPGAALRLVIGTAGNDS
ncbi:MAG: hypothetical protein JWM93_728 [Frankiales bacterium]|nr:hypothetical protein [Frankiales bacterium]